MRRNPALSPAWNDTNSQSQVGVPGEIRQPHMGRRGLRIAGGKHRDPTTTNHCYLLDFVPLHFQRFLDSLRGLLGSRAALLCFFI